jgi:hypothetical protein
MSTRPTVLHSKYGYGIGMIIFVPRKKGMNNTNDVSSIWLQLKPYIEYIWKFPPTNMLFFNIFTLLMFKIRQQLTKIKSINSIVDL